MFQPVEQCRGRRLAQRGGVNDGGSDMGDAALHHPPARIAEHHVADVGVIGELALDDDAQVTLVGQHVGPFWHAGLNGFEIFVNFLHHLF